MLYNKNNVRKTNDKKILHKVGKQWKVISVALLMAIGGGAVATHAANAQSTNASTQALVNSLEAPAPVQKATVAPSSAASSSANSASAKPASSSSVSYVTNNGSLTSGASAASYRDKALNDKSVAASNGNIANGYIKSLNAKFGPVTAFLNGRTASASAKAQSNVSLANSYSVVAKNSDNLSLVSELASKSGLSTPDFVSNVQNEANYYSNSVSAASASASALNLVTSLANQVVGTNWSDMSAEAQTNSAVASADFHVYSTQANANNSALTDAQRALDSNNNALTDAQVASISASGAAAVVASGNASGKSSADSVKASVNSAIASLKAAKPQLATKLASAKSTANANSTVLASASAANNVANFVNTFVYSASSAMSNSNSSAGLLNLLTSAAANLNYYKAFANSARSNAYEATDLASLASAEGFDFNDLFAIKDSIPTIKGLVGNVVNVNDVKANLQQALEQAKNDPAVKAAKEAAKNDPAVKAAILNNSDVQSALNDAKAKAKSSVENAVKNAKATSAVRDAAANARLNHKDVNAAVQNAINSNSSVKSALQTANNLKNNPLNDSSINSAVQNAIKNDSSVQNAIKNDSSVRNAIMSDPAVQNAMNATKAEAGKKFTLSGLNADVSAATTNLSNATSASASYANATDENVTLASYFASSYSTEASSNASVASSYADFANTFYVTQIHNSEFTSANTAARAAAAAEPNDAALANAAGQRVWNYAPKYITVTKAAGLYSNPNYQGAKRFGFAQVGDQLTVTGVGISENGTVHYAVSYKGNNAYITAQPNYVEPTYLQNQGNLSVTTLQGVRVFSDAARTNATGDMVDANTKLDNVHVVSVDNVYGGYTTLETPSGNFITANVKCVKVNVNANNNNAANSSANNNNNVKPANHVNFWA